MQRSIHFNAHVLFKSKSKIQISSTFFGNSIDSLKRDWSMEMSDRRKAKEEGEGDGAEAVMIGMFESTLLQGIEEI